jgi:adenosine deaminase
MSDADHTRLRRLPKVELHRHLEGSLRLTTLAAAAASYDLPFPRTAEELRPLAQVMPGEARSADNFLSKFRVLRHFFCSEALVRQMAREAVADAAEDGVRYLELRFTPVALSNAIGCPFADVIGWVCEETSAESARNHIETRLIVSINRHEPVEQGASVFDAAFDFIDQGVVAVDLAGREADVDVRPFRPLFERARARGLGLTIHAGEWAGPESVRAALAAFEPERIGHGVRSVEDPALLDELARRGTVLEVCPSSNVDSGVVASLAEHALPQLLRAGVRATINTDDPSISAMTLSEEYRRVLAFMPLTVDDVKRMIITAAEAAFLPLEARRALAAAFRERLLEQE